jgi:uncharacterized protein YgiM (DUF1202 family)
MQMSKFNYAKQFAKKEETPVEVEVKEVVIETEVVEELPKPVQEPVQEPVQVPAYKTGVVSDCKKLRVRKGPSKQSAVIAVINENSKVTIEEELADWYKVRAAGNIFGYCAAEFITIK